MTSLYVATLIVVAALLVLAIQSPYDVTFDVAGQTEVVRVRVQDELHWRVPDAHGAVHTLSPPVNSTVVFRRSSNGPLTIQILLQSDKGSGGRLVTVADTQALAAAGNRPVFTLIGQIGLGEELRTNQLNQAYLFESGRIRIIGRTVLGHYFEGGTHDLVSGDEVRVTPGGAPGFGFVALGPDRALVAGFRVVAPYISVHRFAAGRSYPVTLTMFDRIQRDREVQVFLLFLGFVAAVCSFIENVRNRERNSASRETTKPTESRTPLLVLAAALLCSVPSSAEVVLIDDVAQGITRPHGGRCMVIAPAHGVKASEVRVITRTDLRSTAKLERRIVGSDIAILRIEGDPNSFCREGWPVSETTPDDPAPDNLSVRSVKDNGVMISMPVIQVGVNETSLELTPARLSDSFHAKMSGSAVEAQGRIVGMLLNAGGRKAFAIRIGHLTNIIRSTFEGVVPSSNLSGIWTVVPEVQTHMRSEGGDLVRIEHMGNNVKVFVQQSGPDLKAEEGWRAGFKLWDGDLTNGQGYVFGYAPGFSDSGGSLGASGHKLEVPFQASRDGNVVRTELILLERTYSGSAPRLVSRRVTLFRGNSPVLQSAFTQSPTPTPRTVISGQEAVRSLRQAFQRLGYQDFPLEGYGSQFARYEANVRSYNECSLTIEETLTNNPGSAFSSGIAETTVLDLRELDADQIRPVRTGGGMPWPAGLWTIEVPARGPGIQVTRIDKRIRDQSRSDSRPDRVHFFLRYQGLADEAATALRALARACGAR